MTLLNYFIIFKLTGVERKQKKLLSTAVPSVFVWSVGESGLAVSRRVRLARRTSAKTDVHHSLPASDVGVPGENSPCDIDDIGLEVVCGDDVAIDNSVEHHVIESKCSQTDCSFASSQCSSTQTVNQETVHFLSFEQLSMDEQLLH